MAAPALAPPRTPQGTASATPALLPETPRLRRFGVAEGLPSSNINALAQDSTGYLWIASDDGLARFDGVGFRIWRHVPDDPDSLPGNLVQALHVDARGRVWVGVEGQGLAMLLPDGVHFRQYRHANTPAIGEEDVFAIASTIDPATHDSALWFGTFGAGLYRMTDDGRIAHFMPVDADAHSLPDVNVLGLTTDARGVLWIATTGGAARWNGHAGSNQDAFARIDAPGIAGGMVYGFRGEDDGRLWIAAKSGLYQRNANGVVQPMRWNPNPQDPRITNVLRDRDGGYWLSAPQLLHKRDDAAGGIASPVPALTSRVLGMLEDREGGIWFATQGSGLAQLVPGWRQFATFRHDPQNPASLGSTAPDALALADDGRIWAAGGRDAVLDRIDPATGAITHWQPPQLAHKYVWSLGQRGDGPLWVGYNPGLARIDVRSGAVQTWEAGAGKDATLPGPVDLIAQTPDGRVWISSQGGGVQARDGDGHVLIAVTPGDGKGLTASDTEQLGVSPHGTLWLAGAQGLLQWNESTQHFDAIAGSPHDRVYGFAFSGADTLWLHRLGVLERYRWNGRALTQTLRVDATQGLPAVESGGMIVDASRVVWLTTLRGLIRYDPTTAKLRSYGVRDGLPSQEFGKHPPLLTASGLAVASTVDGLVLFNPTRMAPSTGAAPLELESLSVRRDGREVALDPHAKSVIGPDDRDLRVVARLLSFTDPQAHRYRSRLIGFDNGWIAQGSDGERVFSRLDAGHYRLQVQAANADGVWSVPKTIVFRVRPPWWRTTIAYFGYALLLMLFALLVARLYRQRLRRRHAQALVDQRHALTEQASEAKTRFLATMGHEIRTPMTGVLGMTELLLTGSLDPRQRSQAESIQRAGQHLLRLVNDSLDLARIEAGKLALDDAPFDLRALLREVDDLLRPLAQRKNLAFDTDIADDAPRGLRGDAARVRQILLNLGTNAIKFTEQGTVHINVQRDAESGDADGVCFTVDDTGPGLNHEQQSRLFQRFEQADGARTSARYGGSGLGLAICQELAAVMGGSITVDSTPGVGTCFCVMLPLPEAEPPKASSQASRSQAMRREMQGQEGTIQSDGRGNSRQLSLLLVEDDATIAEVLRGLLEAQGHVVTHAAHGLAALSELESETFDVALLDLDLPGVNGLDLARLIRARNIDIPLLAVTARADADAESDAHAAGMDGFLRKPVTGEMLAEVLDALAPSVNRAP
jgi:signal transduction histidine kinase/ActR/RegA family two-component response regulator/streptogramin lyase